MCFRLAGHADDFIILKVHNVVIIIIIALFQEDNIYGRVASLTYGPQLTNVGMIL